MSSFTPNKHHLREILLFCFNLKKNAVESHRMLCEAYVGNAPSFSTCTYWFRRFKNGDFDVNDKEYARQTKKFEDAELQALLNEDPCQTQQQLADSLGVAQSTISDRLKALGMIQKQTCDEYVSKEKNNMKCKLKDVEASQLHLGKEGNGVAADNSLAAFVDGEPAKKKKRRNKDKSETGDSDETITGLIDCSKFNVSSLSVASDDSKKNKNRDANHKQTKT